MSTERKVFYLFITLIVLMITCVFTHVNDLDNTNNETVIVEDKTSNIFAEAIDRVKSITVSIQDDEKNEDEQIKHLEKEIVDEKVIEKIEENKEEEVSLVDEVSSPITLINNIQDTKIKEVVEVKVEEVEEPLIKTDTRYRRTTNEKKIEDLSKKAQLLQLKIIDYLKENPIIFKRGSNRITKNSNKAIDFIVKILKDSPTLQIEVAGHTDAIGSAKLNQRISEQRSISVKNRLVSYKISKNRIRARGYGESIPLVENSRNGFSKVNRRVEFNIIEE
jgi:outer membrane protein OmpA-like peptidoglycan-associated protein